METTQQGVVKKESMYTMLQQPAAMSDEGNIATNWREWKSAFDYYLIAIGKETATSREKCALFMHVIGKCGRDILEELDLDDESKQDYSVLVSKFANHCDPARNVNYVRHVFFDTYQRDEGFDKFLSTLKLKSKACEFGQLRNSLILTQLIRGIKDNDMRERLLSKPKLELENAVSWCRAAETASRQAQRCVSGGEAGPAQAGAGDLALEELRARPRTAVPRYQQPRGRDTRPVPQQERSRDTGAKCDRCGRKHNAGEKCWARNVKCYRCDKIGHFAKMCRSRFVSELDQLSDSEDRADCAELRESLLCTLSIEEVGNNNDAWYNDIFVNDKIVNFKLDSGAEVSVMSLEVFKEAGFCENILKKNNAIIREVSKSKLPVVGYFEPILRHGKYQCKQKVYVLNLNCSNLLGLRACRELNLLSRQVYVEELAHYQIDETVFEGIGCLPYIYKIEIDKNVPPVVNSSRKVPIKIMPRLKEELEKVQACNIIIKEDSPTNWVSNIVIVERPGKLRVCLDPHHLNKAVRRCHFQLPTIEEVTCNLIGAKYFSKLDAKNGFWMLKLDEASSKYIRDTVW